VLWAISPHHAVRFFAEARDPGVAYLVLGSVVLCITGGEALYADMGHFGRKPIVLAWSFLVFPGLLLNYFGQGALILEDERHVEAPFFGLVSGWVTVPLVVLATIATVIASQALISGAFSLTRQAIQLGYLPRLRIEHKSSATEGQIYMPEVNRLLMVACIVLVVGFGSSSRMAAAYGIAVTGTMAITTVLFFFYASRAWGPGAALAICIPMLAIDVAFLGANVVKIEHGGWLPIAVALFVLAVMTSWKRGRDRVSKWLAGRTVPLEGFLKRVARDGPTRVKGTAVFMTASPSGTPPVLVHHYDHMQVLHERIVLLSIQTEDRPYVKPEERLEKEALGQGFYRLRARYGFMQSPNMTEIAKRAADVGVEMPKDMTTYFLGREKLEVKDGRGMARWRKNLFAFLSRNARPASDYFGLPTDRVLEIGMQLEL
jgi:KUP system potassium uptake protein